MPMTDRDGKRIGCVTLWFFLQSQQHTDHVLHLFLGRAALAHNRLLDFTGGVFSHRQPHMHAAADGRTPGLAEFQCGIGILVHKHPFNTHFFRQKFTDNVDDTAEDNPEAFRQSLTLCAYTATGNITELLSLLVNNPVARHTGAGINAEDARHALQYRIINPPPP